MPSLEEGKLPTIVDAKSWQQQPTLVTAKSMGSAVLYAPYEHTGAAAPQPSRWWWRGSSSSSVMPMPKLAKIKVKVCVCVQRGACSWQAAATSWQASAASQDTVEEVCSATAYRSAAGNTLTHKGSAPGTPNKALRVADMV